MMTHPFESPLRRRAYLTHSIVLLLRLHPHSRFSSLSTSSSVGIRAAVVIDVLASLSTSLSVGICTVILFANVHIPRNRAWRGERKGNSLPYRSGRRQQSGIQNVQGRSATLKVLEVRIHRWDDKGPESRRCADYEPIEDQWINLRAMVISKVTHNSKTTKEARITVGECGRGSSSSWMGFASSEKTWKLEVVE